MVRPALRSRSYRRIKKRLPGGIYTTHFVSRNPARPKCAKCGGNLHGIPNMKPIRFSRISKSERTVNRPYGGNLCSPCMRLEIRNKAIQSG